MLPSGLRFPRDLVPQGRDTELERKQVATNAKPTLVQNPPRKRVFVGLVQCEPPRNDGGLSRPPTGKGTLRYEIYDETLPEWRFPRYEPTVSESAPGNYECDEHPAEDWETNGSCPEGAQGSYLDSLPPPGMKRNKRNLRMWMATHPTGFAENVSKPKKPVHKPAGKIEPPNLGQSSRSSNYPVRHPPGCLGCGVPFDLVGSITYVCRACPKRSYTEHLYDR